MYRGTTCVRSESHETSCGSQGAVACVDRLFSGLCWRQQAPCYNRLRVARENADGHDRVDYPCLVELSLTAGAVVLAMVIAVVAWCALRDGGTELAQAFAHHLVDPAWTTSAAKFVPYNSALAPVLLYVAAPMRSRLAATTQEHPRC